MDSFEKRIFIILLKKKKTMKTYVALKKITCFKTNFQRIIFC